MNRSAFMEGSTAPDIESRSGQPRYFFNIHDGDHFTPDHVGVEMEGNRSKEGLPVIVKDEGWTGILAGCALAGFGRPLGHGSVVSVSERAYSQACS
jgi:hypothetical protein